MVETKSSKLTLASKLGQKNKIKTTNNPVGKHNSNNKQLVDQATWQARCEKRK